MRKLLEKLDMVAAGELPQTSKDVYVVYIKFCGKNVAPCEVRCYTGTSRRRAERIAIKVAKRQACYHRSGAVIEKEKICIIRVNVDNAVFFPHGALPIREEVGSIYVE